MQSSNWMAAGVTALTGLIVWLAAAAALLFQKGPRRAALVAGLLPAALIPAVVSVALSAFTLARLFSGMAVAGSAGAAEVLAGTQGVWSTARVGFGAAALVGWLGLLGGLLRFGSAPATAPACSVRRAVVLAALPLLALLVAGLQAHELRLGTGIARAVVTATAGDPARKAAVERYLEAHDLAGHGSAAIAQISERVARAIALASLGGALALVILLGLTVTGMILAWPVRVGPVFVAASSGLWTLLALAGTALAVGLGAPATF